MKLYRINKVTKPGGAIVAKKDILARTDREAVQRAEQAPDCPVCEVMRDGEQVGLIV